MRILYYSPHPDLNLSSPAGYGTHMREMINAYQQHGHEVFPIIMGGTTSQQSNASNVSAKRSVKQLIKPVIPGIFWETMKDVELIRFDRSAYYELRKQVKSIRPQLIYERCNYIQISGGVVSRSLNVKNIVEVNAPYIEERVKYAGRTFLSKKALQREKFRMDLADKIAVITSPLKEYFLKAIVSDPSKIIVTPNAIDPSKISVSVEKAEEIKKIYDLNGFTVFGFVGSIAPWHGIENLIDAFKNIYPKYPKIKLLVVGGGQLLNKLKKKCNDSGLGDAIVFTDNVAPDKVFNYIHVMDVAILPNTDWYMSPIKLFEYGALGKAIIAPNTGGVNDVMEDGVHGLLTGPAIQDLEKAMEKYIQDVELRMATGNLFKIKVLEQHTWYKMAEKVLSSLKF